MKTIRILSKDEAELLAKIREIGQFPEYLSVIQESVETYREISRIARKCQEWTHARAV